MLVFLCLGRSSYTAFVTSTDLIFEVSPLIYVPLLLGFFVFGPQHAHKRSAWAQDTVSFDAIWDVQSPLGVFLNYFWRFQVDHWSDVCGEPDVKLHISYF